MSPTIRVDEDVYSALQADAVPFVDTPNSVLRRLLSLAVLAGEEHSDEAATAGLGDVPVKRTRLTTRQKPRPRKVSADRKRAATGTILAESEYELPLLAILMERGGSAPAAEVLEELGQRLAGRLLPNDLDRLSSGKVRWQNRAQFVRLRLVQAGDMKGDSPRGVWAISEQGRARIHHVEQNT